MENTAEFLRTRMNKEAYPNKSLFKGRQSEVLRAFMFQVGDRKRYITRTVPGLFDVLSETGGLFESFKYILSFLNVMLVMPIDTLEFFFAMQELDPNLVQDDTIEEDESGFRLYSEIQLNRCCGFRFKFTDRLQHYTDIMDDLLSFEY